MTTNYMTAFDVLYNGAPPPHLVTSSSSTIIPSSSSFPHLKASSMDLLKPRSANSSPLTPLSFLDRAATVYGDCTSIIYNDTSYTWSQTHGRCLQLASSLTSLGIKRGDVVSVVAPNIPAMYELHFGVPMCGAILNTINTRLDARTISILLRHSESKLIFVDYQSRSLILEALSLLASESKAKLPSLIFIADLYDESSATGTCPGDLTYENFLTRGDPEFKWVRPASEWDPLVLNYTSGTTSSPKGVVHCHRGIYIIITSALIEWSLPKKAVYLWTLPMFHGNGWSFTWGMAAVGGTNVCLRKCEPQNIYDQIQRHRVTHMCGAPIVLNMLTGPNTKPLPHPVHVQTGGAPPPAPVLSRAEPLGFIVDHAYGLTESGGIAVLCSWKSEWDQLPVTERAKLKSRQGVRALGMTDADVVDAETGQSVKRDGKSLGEIVLRGAPLMLGYFKDPKETSKCMRENGWFYTGDVGVMHPDGYLEIKDRSKDVIITGGENVSSVEVETVLYTHPLVNEVAVVARPDKFWGESPCAFVSLKSDAAAKPTQKELIAFCRARMPHYMVPKTVVFIPQLPKTSTGKIEKFVLRQKAKAFGSNTMPRKSPEAIDSNTMMMSRM